MSFIVQTRSKYGIVVQLYSFAAKYIDQDEYWEHCVFGYFFNFFLCLVVTMKTDEMKTVGVLSKDGHRKSLKY